MIEHFIRGLVVYSHRHSDKEIDRMNKVDDTEEHLDNSDGKRLEQDTHLPVGITSIV